MTDREQIDITMPAVLRPAVLQESLRSFVTGLLHDTGRFRLLINIDPVGSGTREEVEAVCRQFFEHVVVNAPAQGSLNAALRWLWGVANSEFILYLEDDILLKRSVDLAEMMAHMRKRPRLAYIQISYVDFRKNDGNDINVQHEYLGDGLHLRKGKYEMSLQPALMRREFAAAAARLIHDDDDPEIQFHANNPALQDLVSQWEFATFARPGDSRAVQDIGIRDRNETGYTKFVDGGSTTWLPVRKVDVYGKTVRVLDHVLGRITWDEIAERKWRRLSYRVIDRFLRPGDVFVDIGAYIGSIALYAAHTAGRVVCFECDPVIYDILGKNVNLNEPLRKRILLSNKAISHENKSRLFGPWHNRWGTSRSSFLCGDRPGAITVDAMTLERAMKRYDIERVDYIKLITQGAEPEILKSLIPLIKRFRPVLHVSVQPRYWPDPVPAMRNVISALAMYRHIYTEKGKELTPHDLTGREWMKGEYNLVATDREWEEETA